MASPYSPPALSLAESQLITLGIALAVTWLTWFRLGQGTKAVLLAWLLFCPCFLPPLLVLLAVHHALPTCPSFSLLSGSASSGLLCRIQRVSVRARLPIFELICSFP